MGPTFLDIGNFIGELFFLGYTTRIDSTYAEVFDSFINAYRAFGGSLDPKGIITISSAALLELVARRMDLNGNQESAAMNRECVKLALNFIFDAESTDFTLVENDPFAMLSRILRDCLQTM
ncbi:hypothetical protein PRK78_001362 [Emydomyces testavorans]|uniref:Uncharacterized protein n=1 Tax=Emydomyces testavorans TaxID=2070801 RepID=A0AAF0DEC6_9EURO|nr:hypothetical protein PRK78_001362 [Emydomyces testavorans]